MDILIYSPILTLLYVWGLLCIMADVHIRELSTVKKWAIPLCILLLCVFNQMLSNQMGATAYGKTILITMHLPFFLLFFYTTGYSLIKTAFMILTALVFSVPPVIASGLVQHLFPGVSQALLLSDLLSYILMLLLTYLIFRQGFRYLLRYGEDRFFLQFSLVPLLYYVYAIAALRIRAFSWSSISEMLIHFLPSIVVFVFYFLLMSSYKSLSEKREMELAQAALAQELTAAEEQITLLNTAQTQTAVYRHNMRHHLNAIAGFLSAGEPEEAQNYIQKVRSDVEAIAPRRFCENELVNLLCSSFSQKAEAVGIRLAVDAKLPQTLPLSDTELCSLLSNGLENALHAASELEEPYRWVELYSGIRLNKLLIEIKNSYSGTINWRDGLPISGQEDHGYGCRSILSIAERHHGLCDFQPGDGIFTLRVVLPMQEV